MAFGVSYPLVILIAEIVPANHCFLGVVAGVVVIGLAWCIGKVLLNLLPLEDKEGGSSERIPFDQRCAHPGFLIFLLIKDWFLSLLRIHKLAVSRRCIGTMRYNLSLSSK